MFEENALFVKIPINIILLISLLKTSYRIKNKHADLLPSIVGEIWEWWGKGKWQSKNQPIIIIKKKTLERTRPIGRSYILYLNGIEQENLLK